MLEVAPSGEDHGQAMLVAGGDYFVVAARTARLNHRHHAGVHRAVPIESSKGKNASEASTEPCERSPAFEMADLYRVDSAHLTGAQRRRSPGFLPRHDRVRLHVPANGPSEPQIGHLRVRSAARR